MDEMVPMEKRVSAREMRRTQGATSTLPDRMPRHVFDCLLSYRRQGNNVECHAVQASENPPSCIACHMLLMKEAHLPILRNFFRKCRGGAQQFHRALGGIGQGEEHDHIGSGLFDEFCFACSKCG